MQPLFLNEAGVLRTSAYIFAALAGGIWILVGAATVAIFGAVRDKTTRLAERILGAVLLPIMASFFIGLLLTVLWVLIA